MSPSREHTMPDDLDWTLIDAYLAGTASPEQQAHVRQWLAESPERAQMLQALRATSPDDSARWDVDAAWARVSPTLEVDQLSRRRAARIAARPSRRAWQIAAALLVVAGAATLGRQALRSPATTIAATQEVVTRAGERLAVTLPDSSRVTLNAGSRLRYSTAAAGSREVWLDGEAYFDVRHDARRPFLVHAQGGTAEDVGTRFVVRAYPEESHVDVAVAEGAVRIRRANDGGSSTMVTAGMLGRIPAVGAPDASRLPDANRYFAWTRGILSLDGQTLAEAIPALEHWYGVQLRVADPALRDKRVFGTFEHASLPDMLAALTLAVDARWSQSGQVVTLTAGAK